MRISNFSSMCHFFLISRGRARHFHLNLLLVPVLCLPESPQVTKAYYKSYNKVWNLTRCPFFVFLVLLEALRAIFENNGLSHIKRERRWESRFQKIAESQFEYLAKSSLKQGIPQSLPFSFQKRWTFNLSMWFKRKQVEFWRQELHLNSQLRARIGRHSSMKPQASQL